MTYERLGYRTVVRVVARAELLVGRRLAGWAARVIEGEPHAPAAALGTHSNRKGVADASMEGLRLATGPSLCTVCREPAPSERCETSISFYPTNHHLTCATAASPQQENEGARARRHVCWPQWMSSIDSRRDVPYEVLCCLTHNAAGRQSGAWLALSAVRRSAQEERGEAVGSNPELPHLGHPPHLTRRPTPLARTTACCPVAEVTSRLCGTCGGPLALHTERLLQNSHVRQLWARQPAPSGPDPGSREGVEAAAHRRAPAAREERH